MAICNSSTGKGAHLKGGAVGVLAITCPLSNCISPNLLIPLSNLTVERIPLWKEPQCHHRVQQNSFRLNWGLFLRFCGFHLLHRFNSSTAMPVGYIQTFLRFFFCNWDRYWNSVIRCWHRVLLHTTYYFFLTSWNAFNNFKIGQLLYIVLANLKFILFDISHFAWWAVVNNILLSKCLLLFSPTQNGLTVLDLHLPIPNFPTKLKDVQGEKKAESPVR